MLKQLQKKQAGFTVVELLIVIVVIGILAALVLNTFSGVQARGRDTERKTDVNSIATQLEAFYALNNYYPTLANLQDTASGGWVETNLEGVDVDAFVDQDGDGLVAGTDATNDDEYMYSVLPAGCDNTTTECEQFTLTAYQETDTANDYVKDSLNRL